MRNILVGGVGYRLLRDYSVGVVVSDRLEEREWPEHVRVQDLSFNPVAVAQQLEEDLAADPDLLVLFVSAAARGRRPATVVSYRWDGSLPGPDRVQAAVAEAVTGVIALDNTLMVAKQFGGLPEDVVVVEIEPKVEGFGEELTAEVAEGVEEVIRRVEAIALNPSLAERLPLTPLGGGALPHVGSH